MSHKIGISRKKNFLGHFLGKIKDYYSCGQKIQFPYSLVRIVRCRIARTTLDPTVHGFVFIIYIALPWQMNDTQNIVDIDGLHHIHKVDHKIREFKVLGIALLKIKTSSSVTCLSSIHLIKVGLENLFTGLWCNGPPICDFLCHLQPPPSQECLNKTHVKLVIGSSFMSFFVSTSNLSLIFQDFRLFHIYSAFNFSTVTLHVIFFIRKCKFGLSLRVS